MRIKVDGKPVQFKGKTVSDLLGQLCINRESVLVTMDGILVSDSEKILKGADVRVLKVASGG